MRKLAWWFCMFRMTLRRAFCRPIFIMFLLAFPISMAVLHHMEKQDSGKISVALCTGEDAWNQEVAEKLEADDGSFHFYICETQEEAERDVMTGEAECAYLFPDKFKESLDSGDYNHKVTVLVSPSTVAEKIISEKVFSELFEIYGRELLADYGKNGAAFQTVMMQLSTSEKQESACEELLSLYDKYKNNGSTFSFSYQTLSGEAKDDRASMKAVFPVHGMAAIFIFIMGLAASVMAGEDKKNGIYAAVRSPERWLLQTAGIAAFVFMAEISAFAALFFTGNISDLFKETVKLIWYLLAVTAYAFLCMEILKKPGLVAALIPFFILGCILICPIFFDISIFLPEFGAVRRFLPPWWYLKMI